MSLINDALKRARDSQPANPAPPAAGLPPLAPAGPVRPGGAGWVLALAAILFLAAAGLFIGQALFKHRNPPVALAETSPVAPNPAPAPAGPVSAPPAAGSNSAPETAVEPSPAAPAANPPPTAGAEQLPKVQGIIFNTAHPLAIVSGQTVGVGDRVGALQVKEILPNAVIFRRADGSLKRLKIGE